MDTQDLDIKSIYEANELVIGSDKYSFSTLDHGKRLGFFAYFTKIATDLENGNLGFMLTQEWRTKQKELGDVVMLDGMQLNKACNGKYWEEHAKDFIELVSTSFMVISYPFLQGKRGS